MWLTLLRNSGLDVPAPGVSTWSLLKGTTKQKRSHYLGAGYSYPYLQAMANRGYRDSEYVEAYKRMYHTLSRAELLT